MNYPSDPPVRIKEMTRGEFLKECPRTPITLTDMSTGIVETYPIDPDDIRCDLCNADPGDTVYLHSTNTAYCKVCFLEFHLPYCEK